MNFSKERSYEATPKSQHIKNGPFGDLFPPTLRLRTGRHFSQLTDNQASLNLEKVQISSKTGSFNEDDTFRSGLTSNNFDNFGSTILAPHGLKNTVTAVGKASIFSKVGYQKSQSKSRSFYLTVPKLMNCVGFCLAILLSSCQSKSASVDMVERDLLSYGVALTLQVPDSADIKLTDWGLQKDITIKDPTSWYNLQIFSSRALTHSLEKLKASQLELAKSGMYFSEVISEDPDGFIFETKVDSVANYDFRHFKIQGDNEYLFQRGLMGKFTLDEIKLMYEIAKTAR